MKIENQTISSLKNNDFFLIDLVIRNKPLF